MASIDPRRDRPRPPSPPKPPEAGRMVVYALARSEGCTTNEALLVVERMVTGDRGSTTLEDVLQAVFDVLVERPPEPF